MLCPSSLIDEGWAHSGLAYQPVSNDTPLPTVEECLLNALAAARLIEPMVEADGFGCGFERCGRTDAGVSSSAQVINLWVRSDLDDPMGFGKSEIVPDDDGQGLGSHVKGNDVYGILGEDREGPLAGAKSDSSDSSGRTTSTPPRQGRAGNVELPYITILNRLLPNSIRILAWSPVSATFSSRFSCIWRHYKYFFSISPSTPFLESTFDMGSEYTKAFGLSSVDNALGKETKPLLEWQENLRQINWAGLELDLPSMRDAAARVIGEHDYRNLCKVDPPKQLPHHIRTVTSATIDKVEGEGADLYVLNLRGGAFLYNQVRHIVALLFLIGAKLEQPSVIDRLLWTSDTPHRTPEELVEKAEQGWEIVDAKPGYEMADDLALILWQCGYNSEEFDWRIDNAERDLFSSTSSSPAVDASIPSTSNSTSPSNRSNSPAYFSAPLNSLPLSLDLDSFVNGTLSPPAPPFPASSMQSVANTAIDPLLSLLHNRAPSQHTQQRVKPTVHSLSSFRRQFLEMNEIWTHQRLKSVILKHHLASYATRAPPPAPLPTLPPSSLAAVASVATTTTKIAPKKTGRASAADLESLSLFTPLGTGRFSRTAAYVPMLQRKRGDLPSYANEKWANGRGARKMVARGENQAKSDAARIINLNKKIEARKKAGLVDLLQR